MTMEEDPEIFPSSIRFSDPVLPKGNEINYEPRSAFGSYMKPKQARRTRDNFLSCGNLWYARDGDGR